MEYNFFQSPSPHVVSIILNPETKKFTAKNGGQSEIGTGLCRPSRELARGKAGNCSGESGPLGILIEAIFSSLDGAILTDVKLKELC